jgi:NAD(P)-dependent dehydrogenase (short-subunit alcohol dehydrogenase family)
MAELRFDGRVAVVTGAGGNPGLGRAHAMLLAARGAKVVVNDIGRHPSIRGYADEASAETVAAEIRALGGVAVADTNTVATPEGAAAIVQAALDAFGTIDILVNNAAVCINTPFEELTPEDIRRHVEVNQLGPAWICHAAWRRMQAKGYGRIVNIASASMQGFEQQAAYASSKGGVFSLTRALAAEGERFGIKVNSVNPGAFTRMVAAQLPEDDAWHQYSKANLPPEMSSPAVAFLAHESCPVSGECIQSMGGEIHRVYLGRTPGFSAQPLTIETIAERWDEVMAGASGDVLPHYDKDPTQHMALAEDP